MKIVFICTGNTCRSPMAEAMFRHMMAGENIEIRSAGLAAFPDQPASKNTIEVLKEKGIPIEHKSKPLDEELVHWADLILTMTLSHKWHIQGVFPSSEHKVYTLKEYVADFDQIDEDKPLDWDIIDPFGGSLEIYQETAKDLEENLHKLKKKIAAK